MGDITLIEWAHRTQNFWIGCTPQGPECDHCYAEAYAARWKHRYPDGAWGPRARRYLTSVTNWRKPLTWNRNAKRTGIRERVFCESLGDIFEVLPEGHPDIPALNFARAVLAMLIAATPHLDWLLLSKRPQDVVPIMGPNIPANVWIGTTVGTQKMAAKRLPHLVKIDAPVLFVSMEPLLEHVDLRRVVVPRRHGSALLDALTGRARTYRDEPLSSPHERGVDWVINGGESGTQARAMREAWATSLRDQCVATDTPFFFKQWGEHDSRLIRIGKKKAGRLLEGKLWDQVPVVPPRILETLYDHAA